MKKGSTGNLNYNFSVRKVRAGSVNAGGVFLYGGRLWIVLNPLPDGGGKLARTFPGHLHTSKHFPSKTLVHVLENGKKIGKILQD